MNQALAGDIFTDMVVEEAIKDKTNEIEQQAKDAQVHMENMMDYGAEDNKGEGEESDDDFAEDADEEKMFRNLKEARMEAMKADFQ